MKKLLFPLVILTIIGCIGIVMAHYQLAHRKEDPVKTGFDRNYSAFMDTSIHFHQRAQDMGAKILTLSRSTEDSLFGETYRLLRFYADSCNSFAQKTADATLLKNNRDIQSLLPKMLDKVADLKKHEQRMKTAEIESIAFRDSLQHQTDSLHTAWERKWIADSIAQIKKDQERAADLAESNALVKKSEDLLNKVKALSVKRKH